MVELDGLTIALILLAAAVLILAVAALLFCLVRALSAKPSRLMAPPPVPGAIPLDGIMDRVEIEMMRERARGWKGRVLHDD